MNSRIPSAVAGMLVAVLGATDVACAQEVVALKRSADSISALYRLVDREWKEQRRLDSLRMLSRPAADADQRILKIASVTIISDTIVAALAERAAHEVMQRMQEMYGRGVSALSAEQWTLNLNEARDTRGRLNKRRLEAGYRVIGGRNRVDEGGATSASSPAAIADFWRRRADAVMRYAMDSLATIWVGRSIGTGEDPKNLFASIFRELAIGANALGPECYRQNLTACRKALAMEQDDPIGGAFSEGARAALLRLALETGGSEAFSRFMADTTQSIAVRIEAAAGTPVDTLVRAWFEKAMDARPEPASASLPTALMAVLWSSILCVVSLRSSRWR